VRDSAERLRDILEAIERIEGRAPASREALAADEMAQVWVIHHLRIIGEAVRAHPDDVRDRAPETPWTKIVGMRNILVHHYFAVDADAVWAVIERDLTPIREVVRRLLAEIGPAETKPAPPISGASPK